MWRGRERERERERDRDRERQRQRDRETAKGKLKQREGPLASAFDNLTSVPTYREPIRIIIVSDVHGNA